MEERNLSNLILWVINSVLFLVILILVLAMLNGSISFKFSEEWISSGATFGGALSGAALAGYFSLKLFNKNMNHENQKRESEQLVKKAIFLNDYLKESIDVMYDFWGLQTDFISATKPLASQEENSDQDKDLEFQLNNRALKAFQKKADSIFENLKELHGNLLRFPYEQILDYDFVKQIKEHQFLLKKIEKHFKRLKDIEEINTYKKLWEYKDCMVEVNNYLSKYDALEDYLRNLK